MARLVNWCVHHPWTVLAAVLAASAVGYGALLTTPVDAFPDISENQVIVYANWPGHSPQDVEDQLTYPLSTQLQAVAGVRDLRSMSAFGFSQVYVIFHDDIDVYWARSRVLERLASVAGQIPPDARVELGPDATALGQVFWYVLDGPGLDLATLRTVQDYTVRYALQSVEGVAEVASAGGYVREYQIDVSPFRLHSAGVSMTDVIRAVRESSLDVGAKTVEQSGMELAVRGLGFIEQPEDIERLVVGRNGDAPVFLGDIASVGVGAAFRRGALADEVGERVGGVVTIRFGTHPRDVIRRVRDKIVEITPALPPGVRIVPFYDRTQLIDETMQTLGGALLSELAVTALVVLFFLMHVRTSLVVAATLPLAVLIAFVGMRLAGIGADIMSLSGIAIAIGSMVDMAIITSEAAYESALGAAESDRPNRIAEAVGEVAPAISTAALTTVLSFLPVFLLTGQSGKLFGPLAWTKTLSMVGAVVLAITLVPALTRLVVRDGRQHPPRWPAATAACAELAGLGGFIGWRMAETGLTAPLRAWIPVAIGSLLGMALALVALREPMRPVERNAVSRVILTSYRRSLRWALAHRGPVLAVPLGVVVVGLLAWLGFASITAPIRSLASAWGADVNRLRPVMAIDALFPGLGGAFMPPLDEGSYLSMPSLLPRASLSESVKVMRQMNRAIATVPEVSQVVGKAGRAETALDPAPIGMLETVVNLKPPSEWAPGRTSQDILADLKRVSRTPGTTPSWLQPIETRIVMLQSGIRATLALRLSGAPRQANGRPYTGLAAHDALEQAALKVEEIVAAVPGAADVTTMRQGGKPYLELDLDRHALGRYGLSVESVQRVLESAVGGKALTVAVEGRERPQVRVAYARELRDDVADIESLWVPTPAGSLVPLQAVAQVAIRMGPASIRTENGQLTTYVMFNSHGRDEQAVMDDALRQVDKWRRAQPTDPIPTGVSIAPAGRYLSKQEADRRLAWVIPVVLLLNALLLFSLFQRWDLTLTVFSAIPVAMAGGFILIWAYPHLVDFVHWVGLADRPSSGPVELTTAVWVGFIALFGVAVDDGVVLGTYIRQRLDVAPPPDRAAVHDLIIDAGARRIRPMLMTTATTVLALLPIVWSTGRGADLMKPMALPLLGGMLVAFASVVVVPLVYAWRLERSL